MSDSRVPLKDPWIAALLAWLVPGAGHFYQGRRFKAAIFFFCIVGTFTYGLALADWQGVYFQNDAGMARRRAYGYFAQLGVGGGSLPALVQHRRAYSKGNVDETALSSPLETSFVGLMEDVTADGARQIVLKGQLSLKPVRNDLGGAEVDGVFRGTSTIGDNAPETVELKIAGPVRIEPKVGPDPERIIDLASPSDGPGGAHNPRRIMGKIPRPVWNWFQAPLEEPALQALHGRLGKRMEIALVFTWIAGFLNILAIWDAFEGPAYGYGDEEETAPSDKPAPSPAT